MMSIWRLLLLLPMTTTKTQLPSYPRPRGSQHRPSGRPRRRRRAGRRRPLARRRPRHHHPRRHRHHFFLSKSSSSYYLSLLSLDAVDKIAGKRRERERERESTCGSSSRVFGQRERERERERLKSAAAAAAAAALSFLCVRTPCPEEGKFGGVREKKKGLVFKERRLCDSLFWCTSSKIESFLHYSSLSLFSRRSPRSKKDTQKKRGERKRKTKKQHTGV